MNSPETKSIVLLSNGKEVRCSNAIDEINDELKERGGIVTLFLSKQQGEKLTVATNQIVHCVPYD